LAWVVFAAALLVLADTIMKYMKGQASLWDVALAALSCIPGTKGLTTLAALKSAFKAGGALGALTHIGSSAKAAITGMASALRAMGSSGLRRLGSQGSSLRTVADDAAAARSLTNEAGAARSGREVVSCGDPVDVATGFVFLDAVDVELAGAVPVLVRRHYSSGYRLGRSFGLEWASTLDERLVFDDDGVLWLRDDGGVTAYPTLSGGADADAAGVGPVLPTTGTRQWPLSTAAPGEFRVTDPDTGISRVFAVVATSGTDDEGATAEGVAWPAWLVRVEDGAGRGFTIERDGDGTATAIQQHHGARVAVRRDEQALVTGLDVLGAGAKGADLRVGAFGYEHGRLTQIAMDGSSGRGSDPVTVFGYDDRGDLTHWVDSNGYRYDYAYDDAHRCVAQGGTDGSLRFTYEYEAPDPATGLRTTRSVDAVGGHAAYTSDRRCLLVQETNPLGGVTFQTFDEVGRVVARTTPDGATTRWEHDEEGRVSLVVSPGGARTLVERTDEAVRVTLPDGAQTQYDLGAHGRVESVTDAVGAVTQYVYDENTMALVRVVDPVGDTTSFAYDATGCIVAVTAPGGGVTAYDRDAMGRVTVVTDPVGRVTTLTWGLRGQLLSRISPDGGVEAWTYDGEGNPVSYTDADGRTTRVEFGAFDLPVAQVDPAGGRVEYAYDPMLRLVSVTNEAGVPWRYERDVAGQVVAEVDHAGRVTTYDLDAAGRVVETVRAGGSERVEYDAEGRIATTSTTDGLVTRWAYDAVGRLVAAGTSGGPADNGAGSAGGQLTRAYDAVGRLVSETVDGASTTWTYDLAGRPVRRVTPGGVESTWSYGGGGLDSELALAGHRVSVARDVAGQEVSRRVAPLGANVGAGFTVASTWAAGGRLASRTAHVGGSRGAAEGPVSVGEGMPPVSGLPTVSGEALWSMAFGYTGAGDLASAVVDGVRSEYELDPLGRVTAVLQAGIPSQTYGYDATGNLVGSQVAPSGAAGHDAAVASGEGERELRSYRGSELVRSGRDRYTYDDRGRLVRRRRALLSGGSLDWVFDWDDLDRLTSVLVPDGSSWVYGYDALGRRVAKTHLDANGAVLSRERFAWDGPQISEHTTLAGAGAGAAAAESSVTWEYDQHGHPIAQVSRRGGELAADGGSRHTGSESVAAELGGESVEEAFHAIVTDLVGAPSRLLAPDGSTVWSRSALLWGEPGRAGDLMPLRFPGQFADAETGLLYNVFRYYDPVNARYISSDPLGQEPGPNTYAYVTNPTTLTDPLGLSPCGDAVDAGTPVGRRVVTKTFYDEAGNATGKAKYGWELKVAPGTNSPAVIGGRSYSGHALDQMQGRGILPSAVEDAIGYSTPAPSRGGTSVFYSSANDLSVVVNSEGRVVTTSFGDLR
jgi:RHS repeat-associated protein